MQVKVRNQLTITDYPRAMLDWCNKYLVLDNPEFHKKERMGLWVGSTPRYIWLFEKVGDELRIPFGCIQAIHSTFGKSIDYDYQIQPIRAVDYQSNINLYPYQENAVNAVLERKNGILVAPCGSGKTNMGMEIIARIGGRALWLTHTQDLLNQSLARAKSVLDTSSTYGKITAGKVDIGTGITFATVQTMSKIDLAKYKDTWDIIICDECMPSNTLIVTPYGQKELKNLHIDDIITSYNRNTKTLENKRVTHIFKNKAHDIVKVKLSNGEEIICTNNHPIFTKDRQWIDAERLVNDDYVLRLVRKGNRLDYPIEDKLFPKQKKRLGVLFKGVCHKWKKTKGYMDGRTKKKSIGNNESNKRKISRCICSENEGKQSIKESRNKSKGFQAVKRDWTSSKNQMWERSRVNCSTTESNDCYCKCRNRKLCRISCSDKNETRKRLSYLLQNRYCNSRLHDCNRSGWKFSLCNRKAKSRQKERCFFEWVRVESIEVQKQTSDGTFGGLCSDGYVYNIEVEDNNNYFANGILVHNCQHCCGSPTKVTQFYKVISSLSARYKIGLTATPKRADGLEQSMFALLGGIIHEVSREDVKDTTCPVQVLQVETGYEPNYNAVLMGDGTINYSKLVDDLIHDKDRYKLVLTTIEQLPAHAPILVLANRIEYLRELNRYYYGRSNFLSATGASKRAKEERKRALEALNNGDIDCLFASYKLASEGLDIPNLRYIVLATPEKDSTIIEQSTGRVARKSNGKDHGTVIDLIDDFGLYKSWHKKRLAVYKKCGYDII